MTRRGETRRYRPPRCPVCHTLCAYCAADGADQDELSDQELLADVLRRATPVADDGPLAEEEVTRILKEIGGLHVA
jgi:hypothetical protein